MRRWVPKAYADRPIYIFETGGSTGVPKSRINIDDFRIDYEMFSDTLPDERFRRARLADGGAERAAPAAPGGRTSRAASRRHLLLVDLDPRWVIKLIKARQMDQVEAYKRHVIDQALTLLKAHDNIRCMFITPKLLEALGEKISLRRPASRGVFCGGTEMTPQFHRWVEELLDDVVFRADLRQHADGAGGAQAARSGRRLRDHLLPAVAARDDRGRRSRPSRCRSSTTARPAACG